MCQLATGIAIGVTIAAHFDLESEGELTGGLGLVMLPAVAACGRRIPPTEALREQ